MSIALLVLTDGRKELIQQTIPSALSMLEGPTTGRFIYDDSGDPSYRIWLHQFFPTFELIFEPDRLGFGGAIQAAWSHLKQYNFDWIYHLEDDFLHNRSVPLNDMIQVLEDHPYLYQMALRRQAWNEKEKQAGGVIEQYPEAYTQKKSWIEQRLYFTTNPGLYRRSLLELGWPQVVNSEGIFTHQILDSDSAAQFGLWGLKTDEPWVTHIGVNRVGTGY